MAFVDKNANLLLLFLIVISATGLVAATVYFQQNFENINQDYDTKVALLNKVSDELENQRSALEAVRSELLLKENREDEIVEKFTGIKEEKKGLEEDKTNLQTQNEILESSRIAAVRAQQTAESDLGDAIVALSRADREAEFQRSEAERWRGEADRRQNSLNTFTSRLSSCKNTCGSGCDGI
ncbi:MAG: hypothetical protein QF486_02445 [Candidatus Woesearchaeota archaeon]|jgi:septal ring factor EnvC (AmiA/AmiB activator)|nr:hypothetical protein [Candidatus Woesearchaeota archaeon]MDP7181412.1 hypothetical protein [Candidatus Woesearchaeota archaeon]MDP7198454.1 hypothetical protein [Candidatus Woesearchaeota archaeon]MDP7466804.1 hypothetical protein [Candidatus Woesearchaeota archaeon]MDP7648029.1 hypothetical protein [Candidatus Woesearchaeota archaeon]